MDDEIKGWLLVFGIGALVGFTASDLGGLSLRHSIDVSILSGLLIFVIGLMTFLD